MDIKVEKDGDIPVVKVDFSQEVDVARIKEKKAFKIMIKGLSEFVDFNVSIRESRGRRRIIQSSSYAK